jgi:membrane-associated phospholipid phosphatase
MTGRPVPVFVCASLALVLGSSPSRGQDPAPAPNTVTPTTTESPAPDRDGRRTLGRLPSNILRNTVGVFSTDNLLPLAVGAAVTGIGSAFDDQVKTAVADPGSAFGKDLSTAGGTAVSVAVVFTTFVAGRFASGQTFRDMSYDMATGALVNLGYTSLLKVTVRRERPDHSDNQSFPSGHASNAFTLAEVARSHYGWKVGVPAYALASTIAYSRLVQNKHYLSDVLAGSTLGFIVGRTAVRTNGAPVTGARKVSLGAAPLLEKRSRGLDLVVSF